MCFPGKRGAAQIGGAPVYFHLAGLRHAADISQRHRLAELNLRFATELAQQVSKMERPAGVAGVEQNTLTVNEIFGQSLRQIFMADRRRGDDDQVDVLHHRRQMRAHEIRRGLFANAAFDQLDLAQLGQFGNRAFRTREQSHLETAQREIGSRRATAVARAQYGDFFYVHWNRICRGAIHCALRIYETRYCFNFSSSSSMPSPGFDETITSPSAYSKGSWIMSS